MKEDKAVILEKLHDALLQTRAGNDIDCMALSEEDGTVEILFENGFKRTVNVDGDSGIAMIRDICKAL